MNENRDKQFTVNSEETWFEFVPWARAFYDEHKWVTFLKPRIGKDRTVLQNDFSFEAYTRIGKQLYGGDTQHARCECKLNIGCIILSEESAEFKEFFDSAIAPLDYGSKLKAMKIVPVTSLMTRPQFNRYMKTIERDYTEKGVDFQTLFEDKKEVK